MFGLVRCSARAARFKTLRICHIPSPTHQRCFSAVSPQAYSSANLAYKPLENDHETNPDVGSLGSGDIKLLEQVKNLSLHPVWLRDVCACEHCVDPSSGQKKIWTVDIPPDIQVKSRIVNDAGELEYTWDNDLPGFPSDHTTKLQPSAILEALSDPESLSEVDQVAWTASTLDLHEVDYESYLTSPSAFAAALLALRKYGLFFVTNVPESEQSVINTATRIGPLRNTFYGTTWDVKSVPQAKNVAYTSGHLGFHQDLCYMHDPPRLQFLHCLRSSAAGGASLFSDGFRAVVDVHASDPAAYQDLCDLKTKFHYIKDGKHYIQKRPMVELKTGSSAQDDPLPSLRAVNWSPPFQGPFTKDILGGQTDGVQRWHHAARAFRDASEKKANIFERMMRPGECVVFDNQRILHARTAFEPGDAGKERWLKGCYADADPLWSAWRVMARGGEVC